MQLNHSPQLLPGPQRCQGWYKSLSQIGLTTCWRCAPMKTSLEPVPQKHCLTQTRCSDFSPHPPQCTLSVVLHHLEQLIGASCTAYNPQDQRRTKGALHKQDWPAIMSDKPESSAHSKSSTRSAGSKSMKPAGDFLWRGPSFMSRMAGHEAPHVAPRANETKMKKVRRLFIL